MGSKDSGDLKITDTYLKDFAQHKLANFISALTTGPSIAQLREFAQGLPQGATPGGDPSGGYNQLLTGNPAALSSGVTLQQDFKTLTSTLWEQIQNLTTNAKKMSADLLAVDLVLTDSDDKAHLTSADMRADLENLNFGVSLGGSNPNTSTTT
ncbi:hypothetical protein [Streptomyces sp. IBSBF 2435]|uniref:hypothetical protein n=1 Tax=Streptomyces sp. IBSBF 2435 TaxID=2903531 RepID=UPI002FDBE620